MRAVYDTTCDIINGPGTASPGTVRHANVPCRLVVETIILPREKWVMFRTHYVTMDEFDCHAEIITTTGVIYEIITKNCDRLAIPSGAASGYTVLWTEAITPTHGTPYLRVNVRNSP